MGLEFDISHVGEYGMQEHRSTEILIKSEENELLGEKIKKNKKVTQRKKMGRLK